MNLIDILKGFEEFLILPDDLFCWFIILGEIVSGEIEIGSINHRFVMGLPVNIAARLQNATKELNNSFIVSSEVYNYLSNELQNPSSAFINLKGVTNDIKVFLMGEVYADN